MPSVFAVVVLYQVAPYEARTLQGLVQALAERPALREDIRILLWDNSPVSAPGSPPFEYIQSTRNLGVSGAYNAAAAMAKRERIPWLLLLDQDTAVTADFLFAMVSHAARLTTETQVAAVVPLLYAGDVQISPRYVRFNRHVPIPPQERGIVRKEMFAANSGCLLRVAALQEMGGYSPDFWLDYSDIYLFHQLYRRGLAVYVAEDARLQHEIAMMDYDARMTPERYGNFLAAEGAFHDLYKGNLENAAQLLRLLMRAWRQRRYRNREFSRMTLLMLGKRLLHRRSSRLAAWRRANEQRNALD